MAVWRTGAFAGEFGDAFIRNSNLEGGHVGPSIRTLLSLLLASPGDAHQPSTSSKPLSLNPELFKWLQFEPTEVDALINCLREMRYGLK